MGKPLSLDEIYATAGHLFRRASQINTALHMSICAGLDLTPVQFIALTAIAEVPGVDVTRLSSLIAFDRSTLGGVVERLESKGLIVRASDKVDRRVKLLYATPSATDLLEATAAEVRQAADAILKPLAPADRKTLLRIMQELVQGNSENLPASIREAQDAPADTPVRHRAPRAASRLRARRAG